MDKRLQRYALPVLRGSTLAGLLMALAACGDPLEGARLTDVQATPDQADEGAALLSQEAAVAAADAPTEEQAGVLGWLFAQKDAAPEAKTAEALPRATLADKADATDGAQDPVQLASLPSDAAGQGAKSGFGLFKMFGGTAPEAPEGAIPFGRSTRFGDVGIVCDYPKRDLGTLVAQHPEKKPLYRLYDSDPADEGLRSFYVTGFGDGCLRQVMGTAVVFGSVEMHEQLRYGLPSDLHPFTPTDKAYEKLKRRLCKVRAKEPCGEKRSKLTPNTVFVSVYDTRGLGQGWANMLLHDGAVLASHHTAE